jgi:hypothetical protein
MGCSSSDKKMGVGNDAADGVETRRAVDSRSQVDNVITGDEQ